MYIYIYIYIYIYTYIYMCKNTSFFLCVSCSFYSSLSLLRLFPFSSTMLSSSPLLLLLLLFLPRSLGCQTGSFTECQQAPFVPGHNLAGEGFNVVKMQTTGASVVDVKNFMVGGVHGNCTVCHNHLLNQVWAAQWWRRIQIFYFS